MMGFVRDMARVLRMPCRAHAEIMSRACDAPLSRGTAFGLRVHLVYCAGCRAYRAHLRRLRASARALGARLDAEAGMPGTVRERVSAAISRSQHENP